MPENEAGLSDQMYEGPERRATGALAQLFEVKTSVDNLGLEVAKLTAQLEKVNEIELAQKKLGEGVAEQDEANQAWRHKATWRTVSAIAVVLVLLAGLAALAIIVAVSGSDTSTRFGTFQRQSVFNCNVRNQQSEGTRTLINLFITLVPNDAKTGDMALRQGLVSFEKSIPVSVDCSKLG